MKKEPLLQMVFSNSTSGFFAHNWFSCIQLAFLAALLHTTGFLAHRQNNFYREKDLAIQMGFLNEPYFY